MRKRRNTKLVLRDGLKRISALCKKDDKQKEQKISYKQMLRFATRTDKILIAVGILSAIGSGILFPFVFLNYGRLAGIFLEYELTHRDLNNLTAFSNSNTTSSLSMCLQGSRPEPKSDAMFDYRVQSHITFFVAAGFSALFLNYVAHVCWNTAGEKQTKLIRYKFYQSILRQDAVFFDQTPPGELGSIMTGNIETMKQGLNYKAADFIYFACRGLTCLVLSLSIAWRFTIVFLAIVPVMVFCTSYVTNTIKKYTRKEFKSYEKAGNVATEALASLRTVASLGIERRMIQNYSSNLVLAEQATTKKGLITGLFNGVTSFFFNSIFAIGIYYGVYLSQRDCVNYGPANIVTAFFSLINTSYAFGQAMPFLKDYNEAKAAAFSVYKIIDSRSTISLHDQELKKLPDRKTGTKLFQLRGLIKFENVQFSYPTRPDTQILRGLSLKIEPGKTVALVGSSGGGKSTVISLLQRFYLPNSGCISLDNEPIENLDLEWFRDQMALVSQEPVLFSTSIKENIRLSRPDATDVEIEQVARQANAHEFIMKTSHQYDTLVGERGAQLSGGQKQRIAIARALLRNPKILLLDEATSALDNESERMVQDALNKAKVGRTTVIIAHRLSTIRNADQIAVLSGGQLIESGTHLELMDKEGFYHELVQSQQTEPKSQVRKLNIDAEELLEDQDVQNDPKLFAMVEKITRDDDIIEEKRRTRRILDRLWADFSFHYERKLLNLNRPEMRWIIIGCLSQLVNGAIFPATTIIFCEIYKIFKLVDDRPQQKRMSLIYMGTLFGIAVLSMACQILNYYAFGISGGSLTRRLRIKSFEAMVRQEIGFHDAEENRPSALATKLSTSAPYCKGITGDRFGLLCQGLGGTGFAILFSFFVSWKLTLLMLIFVPIIFGCGVVAARSFINPSSGKKGGKHSDEEGGRLFTESIDNIKTVLSLGREEYFLNEFSRIYSHDFKKQLALMHLQAFFYSLSNNIVYFVQCSVFSFGFWLIKNDSLTTSSLFQIYGSMTFSTLILGRVYAQLPDQTKAKAAARDTFKLIERQSKIDPMSEDGIKPDQLLGNIRFENVCFRYPTRPNVRVLDGFNLEIKNGQTNALVGSSGCGKSTTVALLLRFYDIESGTIYLDDHDIRALNIAWLRSKIGLVSQEPVLFDASIYENICYGEISRKDIPIEEVIEAATESNIHFKIDSLPQKYDTVVGYKGTQLSGGEKQRVAIARALIRKPKILLLDEATSALDNQSEKVVQEALDRAKQGRTCIVIAHRLSTIKNSDKITVVRDGKVIEEGNHDELMANKQFYYILQSKS